MINAIIIISFICFTFLSLLIKPIRKALTLKKVLVFLLLFVLISNIPFESIFFTFPSVEAAWDYENDGKILKVINGKLSSVVVSQTEKGYSFAAYPRANNGWKLNTVFGKIKFVPIGPEKGVIIVCKTQNPNERIIIIDEYAPLKITDNVGSVFNMIQIYPANQYMNTTSYYAVIGKMNKQYELTVGDEMFVLDIQ